MVPEALAFSVIAGVAPVSGLQSAGVIAIVASLTGGQPGNVFGAAGATAVVVGPLTTTYGVEYLYVTVILAGIWQVCVQTQLPHAAQFGSVHNSGLHFAQLQLFDLAVLSHRHELLPHPHSTCKRITDVCLHTC